MKYYPKRNYYKRQIECCLKAQLLDFVAFGKLRASDVLDMLECWIWAEMIARTVHDLERGIGGSLSGAAGPMLGQVLAKAIELDVIAEIDWNGLTREDSILPTIYKKLGEKVGESRLDDLLHEFPFEPDDYEEYEDQDEGSEDDIPRLPENLSRGM